MAIPTVPVSVSWVDQHGAPVENITITATLNRVEVYNGFVVPADDTAKTNAAGAAILNLFPNALGSQGSEYVFKISTPSGKTRVFQAVVPNVACTLDSIANLPAYPGKPDGYVAIYSALAAATAAAADVVTATAQAGIATTKAGEAAADVLLTHADVVTATAQAGIATTKAGEAAADVLLTHADVVAATAQADAAAVSAAAAMIPSQALSADYTILATDMGSVLMCTGPMSITFPAAGAIGAYAVPIFVVNINIPLVAIVGLPYLLDHLNFGQCEGFLSDGFAWRRMVGNKNLRVDDLYATTNAAPWNVVLSTDYLAPVALNQITPSPYQAFTFKGRVLARAVSTTTQNQRAATWDISGSGYIDGTPDTLVLFAVNITNSTSNTGWAISVTADLVHGSVQVAFSGDQPVRLFATVQTEMLQ